MFLENLVFDAVEPRRLGQFWEEALGTQTLTDEADGFETRLSVPGGPTLDLCFQRVSAPTTGSPRLHLDLHGQGDQAATVDRLLGLGARHLDIGQGDVSWVVLADPEGHPFCVLADRGAYPATGPIEAVPVLGDDPGRDAAFWAGFTGWQEYAGTAPASLRDPSGRGPVLEFFTTREPKRGKNRLHLDLRLEPADDPGAVLERAEALGARRFEHDWGDLPGTVMVDPSGNEFCFLPARTS
jgi:hypothetical protein